MTDETERPEIEEVRRLLADARHTAPMPDDVATRMEDVLADLSGEPAGQASAGEPVGVPAPTVVSLAAQRRRRAAGLLVAAAAIVVGGVVVAQHLPHGGQASETAGGERSPAAANGSSGNTGNDSASAPKATTPGLAGPSPVVRHGRVLVRPQHFTADALAGRGLLTAKNAANRSEFTIAPRGCVHVPPHSQALKALYRRAPAVLVYHRPAGTSQVVDLFVCGSSRPLRSVTLPTP